MLLAVALTLLAQRQSPAGPCGPGGPIFCATQQYAFFEFAPMSGQGMGAPCACTNPTGAKGETLTFTRASSGTCLKGSTTTGIANGDMVTCAANQPRVMPGGDGTGGVGLLVEGARTNSTQRSQEADNVYWSKISAVVAAPTVTADQAVAPDGTTTADRVVMPATSGAEYSVLYNANSCAIGTNTFTVWAKGNGASSTIDVGIDDGTNWQTAPCAYNSTTWTRCLKANVTRAGSATGVLIGNASLQNGGTSRVANDVFIWGMDCENGTFASSYIATAGAAVTRAAETATFSASLTNTTGSFAGTIVLPPNYLAEAGDHGIVALSVAGPAYRFLLDYASTPAVFLYTNFGTGGSASVGYAATPGVAERFAGYWDASNRTAVAPSGSTTNAIPAGAPSTTLIEIGSFSGASQLGAVVKRVCVDPSPARCR